MFLKFAVSAALCCVTLVCALGDTVQRGTVTLKPGVQRLLGQPWKLDHIPALLKGNRAVIVSRGRSDRPGQSFDITLKKRSAVYIGVHRRGQPELPSRWKRTGLVLTWGSFADDVYATIAEAGTLTVPEHNGRAGLYGVPHIAIVTSAVDAAKELMADPVQSEAGAVRPAELHLRTTGDTPGLYAVGGEELRWRFTVYRKPARPVTSLEVTIREAETDGAPLFEERIAVSGNTSEEVGITLPRPGFYIMDAEAPPECNVTAFKGGLARIRPALPPSSDSPWGAMRASSLPREAELARRLGVSWIRHTTWATGELTIDEDGTLTADFSDYVNIAKAYHEHDINIMADIQMVPRELSSRPEATQRVGDAGPLYVRVAPRDWRLWESYVEQLVRQAQPMIQHWEIGNEPNTPNRYWAGTVEEFARFVKHTGDAIRRVDPQARIILAGFTLNPDGPPYLERLLELGCGEYLDILSVHSLYGKARTVDDMRKVLAGHGLSQVPVWSTEPKHELPIRNFAAGIEVNMHFLLSAPGAAFYSQFRNLSGRGGTATRAGVIYANAARLIGGARFVRRVSTGTADAEAGLFQSGNHVLLAVNGEQGPRGAVLVVRVTPGEAGARYVDGLGHVSPVSTDTFEVPLDRSGFLVDARRIDVVESRLPEPTDAHGIVVPVAEAEIISGFRRKSDRRRPSYAAVWTTEGKPALRFPFTLDKRGTYEVYSVIQWAERGVGRLLSPFSWQIDDRTPTVVRENLPMHWRDSTRRHLRFSPVPEEVTDTAQGRQLHKLGVVRHLEKGRHDLTIRLEAPRQHDQRYNMEIEQIVLRLIRDDLE